jgi:hypothetical protein
LNTYEFSRSSQGRESSTQSLIERGWIRLQKDESWAATTPDPLYMATRKGSGVGTVHSFECQLGTLRLSRQQHALKTPDPDNFPYGPA